MFHRALTPASVDRAEVLAAFSYALDLTEGQPQGHSARACWIAMQVGRTLGLSTDELGDLYYTVLLKDLGCSSNAARICELYEADDRSFKRAYKTTGTSLGATLHFIFSRTAHRQPLRNRVAAIRNILVNGTKIADELILSRCTTGADIARTLRFPEPVSRGIYHLDEHWDGSGRPDRLRGAQIPLFSRLALLAQIAEVFNDHAGPQASLAEVRCRSAVWLDPQIVRAFEVAVQQGLIWEPLASPLFDANLLALAPSDTQMLADEDYLDAIASAFGEVIDAKSPFTAGHSQRVAELSTRIGNAINLEPARLRMLRRAAFLHDVGKLGVSSTVLEKPAGLDPDEWIEMRGHAETTREILGRIDALRELADFAAAHHERLDGSGYPRQLKGHEIPIDTRIITVCDFYDALTADRPYRTAMTSSAAIEVMNCNVGTAIDADCFEILKCIVEREDPHL